MHITYHNLKNGKPSNPQEEVRLLADVEGYPKSYFQILAQKGKKLLLDQK